MAKVFLFVTVTHATIVSVVPARWEPVRTGLPGCSGLITVVLQRGDLFTSVNLSNCRTSPCWLPSSVDPELSSLEGDSTIPEVTVAPAALASIGSRAVLWTSDGKGICTSSLKTWYSSGGDNQVMEPDFFYASCCNQLN